MAGSTEQQAAGGLERAQAIAARLLANLETVVVGKHDELALVLAALMSGGHVLLEDVPGTAKTILARAIAQSLEGRHVRAHPVHARPAADRRHRALDLQPADARVRVPARSGLRERRARRRDQPRDAADAVGAARGDGGAPGDGRRCHARAARAVPRDRHREPDRPGGDVPAPRGAARPVLRCARPRLSGADEEVSIVVAQRHGHPLDELGPVVDVAELASLRAPSRTSTSTT